MRRNRLFYLLLIVSAAVLTLSIIFGLAFPWLVIGVNKPKNTLQAKANGEELLERPGTVLAVGAHPDDLECDIGGTLARLKNKGATIFIVVSADKSAKQHIRQKEQLEASKILKYKQIVFLGHQDGALRDLERNQLRDEIAGLIEKFNVDTVITFDSEHENWLYKHPDHKAAGEAAIAAAEIKDVPRLYTFFSSKPDTWVDITGTIDKKIESMLSFKSQHSYYPPFFADYYFTNAARAEGAKVGYSYAESFRRVR